MQGISGSSGHVKCPPGSAFDAIGAFRLSATACCDHTNTWNAAQLLCLVALTAVLLVVACGVALGGVYYALATVSH